MAPPEGLTQVLYHFHGCSVSEMNGDDSMEDTIVSTGTYNLVRTHKNLTYIHQYIYIDIHMSYT